MMSSLFCGLPNLSFPNLSTQENILSSKLHKINLEYTNNDFCHLSMIFNGT